MARAETDILLYVEDPGAANLVVGLPEALAEQGRRVRLFAPAGLGTFLAVHEAAFEVLPANHDAEALLSAVRPKVVAVGTSEDPDTPGFALVAAAIRRGLATAGLVDGPANPHLRFRGRGTSAFAHAPRILAVPDDTTAGLYADLGFERSRIAVCGHPLYDRVRAARASLESEGRIAIRARTFGDAVHDKRVVLFLAELSDGLDPSEFRRGPGYTLAGRGGSERRTDIVLEEVLDALADARDAIHFAVRLHPKNTEAEFAPYRAEIDSFSSGGSPWEPCFAADLVVGLTTSLLFEAALLGRPTLSVLPRAMEKSWLPAIASGVTRCAMSRGELANLLPAAAVSPTNLGGTDAEATVRFGACARLARLLSELTEAR